MAALNRPQFKLLERPFILVGGTLIWVAGSFALLHPQFEAWFWLIDDHEIIRFTGPDGLLPWRDYFDVLLTTEFGHPGQFERYRPVYYILKVGEAALWGDRPQLWYASRMAFFGLLLAAVWWALSRATGFVLATALTIYLAGLSFWQHVLTRLGPAELYVTLGWAALIFGSAFAIDRWRRGLPPGLSIWAISIGTAIAVGSKENNLFLLPLLILFGWMAYRRHQLGFGTLAALALPVATGATVVAAVSLGMRSGLVDVYGNSILSLEHNPAANPFFWTMAITSLFFVLVLFCLLRSRHTTSNGGLRELATLTVPYIGFGFILVYVAVTQLIFYGGQWPTNSRYDFPGRLLEIATYAAIAHYAMALGTHFPSLQKLTKTSVVIVAISLVGITAKSGFRDTWHTGHANVERTNRFRETIRAAAATLNAQPTAPVTLKSASVFDYEPAYAIPHFLRLGGVTNSIFLSYETDRSSPKETVLEERLDRDLHRVARDGGVRFPLKSREIRYPVEWLNEPEKALRSVSDSQACFEIVLSGESGALCTQLDIRW